MKVLILFESCTGNTRLAAEVGRRTLEMEGHTCAMRKYRETPASELDGYDLYGFVFPIQSFAPLAPVYDYVKAMPGLPGKPAFILTTAAGWAGAGHRMMARLLHGHGMIVLGAHMMPSPSSWPLSRILVRHVYDIFTLPRKRSIYRTRAFVVEMANRAYRVNDGLPVRQAPHTLLPTITLPMGFNAVKGNLKEIVGTRTVDTELCSRCRTCVDGCPVGAVSLDPFPVFGDNCIGCFACFNNCPYSAILTTVCKPKHYYGGIKDPEKLLKKAGL
jgi:ferredoxin